MRGLILMVCVALLMLEGCNTRKVAITHTDSTAVTTIAKEVHSIETHIDTGKVKQTTQIVASDTGSYVIQVTPKDGKVITVTSGGIFTGEATSVSIKGKKGISKTMAYLLLDNKGITDTKKVDSTAAIKQIVHLEKKIKAVDSKPDYSWILWIVGIICVLGLVLWLYEKYKPF